MYHTDYDCKENNNNNKILMKLIAIMKMKIMIFY